MKFEKRADGGEVTPASSETPETGKKPVIIYILILFLAAFLLMFLSMLSHQRSNTEALGQLQNSVSAIQELKVISDSISDLEKTSQALLALYNLQQEYLTGNLDGCLLTLQEISDQHLDELLPSTNTEGVTPPAQRYQELKEAILNK